MGKKCAYSFLGRPEVDRQPPQQIQNRHRVSVG